MDYNFNSELFKALGHPVRLRILEILLQHHCNVTQLIEALNLPQSTVSQHLGLLKILNIIAPEKEGVKTAYKVVDPRVIQVLEIYKENIDYNFASEVFKALGHPVRLRILEILLQHHCNVTKLIESVNLPQSTVSQHLGLFKILNIIVPEKEGVKTAYKVVDERVIKVLDVFKEGKE